MNKTKTLLATPIGVVTVVGLLLLAAVALSGCAEPVAVAAVLPTATVYAPPPTEPPPPPPEPTPVALNFPLPAPEKEAVEEVNDQTCVDCHSDEETLKALATEVEQEEALSEGEG